jgi:hypothetical protein
MRTARAGDLLVETAGVVVYGRLQNRFRLTGGYEPAVA